MRTAPFNMFASVPTGLEGVALNELEEAVLHERSETRRGKVLLRTEEPFERLAALRSVFRLFAYLGEVNKIPQDASGLEVIKAAAGSFAWDAALAQWRAAQARSNEPPSNPAFRVTVRRSGEQAYTSVEAAGAIGAGVQQTFGWPVNLDSPQLEVFVQLVNDHMLCGITLTPMSLHHLRGTKRGRAGLKGPVAHCLARLAKPQHGETVLDPMCGAGTISLEAALLQPEARHIASDIDVKELALAAENARLTSVNVELHKWDARCLLLGDDSIDAVLCDLPFGRRVSSPIKNRHLYPSVLHEMARVLKPGGRAVLLTLERRLMNRLIDCDARWHVRESRRVCYGGLGPQIYMLQTR